MAIASIIIQPQNGEESKIQSALQSFPDISFEKLSPKGELILLAEGESLSSLQKICLELEKIPGVLGVLPSYVTTADEESV